MLDFLEQIPAEWRPLALLIFVVGGAVSAVLTYHRGRRAGPEQPKVQEFYAAGQLADMGPVKELIEGVGLVTQQMVRANIASEETAKAIKHLGDVFEAHIEEQRREREIAEEVARQLKEKR